MCNNCYHSNGRNKKAWKCSHLEKTHYALGVCQNCYQSKYTTKVKNSLKENIGDTYSSDHSQEEKNSKKILNDEEKNFQL